MGIETKMSGLNKPLNGITVLSLAEQLPGPLCTRLLADLGADVIQLERPGHGDPQREINPWLFRSSALGKRSIALDLKSPAERQVARKLADRCQVFVEGFRPGVVARLGLDYDTLRTSNPALVYCSISGYGQTGPDCGLSGHNINYEAVSGVLDPFAGPEAEHDYVSSTIPMGDVLTGALAAVGIVAACRQAERTGLGAYLDFAINDSLIFTLAPNLTRIMNGGEGWTRREAGYGIFDCADGSIALGIAFEDNFWADLCKNLELPEYADLPRGERVARRDEIRSVLSEMFRSRPVAHWLTLLAESSVPCSRVNRLADVAANPQVAARGMFATALDEAGRPFATVASPFSRATHGGLLRPVPALGASTEDVMRVLGCPDA